MPREDTRWYESASSRTHREREHGKKRKKPRCFSSVLVNKMGHEGEKRT